MEVSVKGWKKNLKILIQIVKSFEAKKKEMRQKFREASLR